MQTHIHYCLLVCCRFCWVAVARLLQVTAAAGAKQFIDRALTWMYLTEREKQL